MSEIPTGFSEDVLLAFADGTLAGDKAEAVEAALSRDAALRETMRLLRLGSSAVADAFGQTLIEPVPARLLAVARDSAAIKRENRGPGQRFASRWGIGLAAGLAAFGIGFGASYLLHPSSQGYSPASEGALDPLTARFEVTVVGALDKGAEGQVFAYAAADAGDGKIEIGRSFTTAFGSECREFRRQETRGKLRSSDNGLACRGSDRAWNLMILGGGQ